MLTLVLNSATDYLEAVSQCKKLRILCVDLRVWPRDIISIKSLKNCAELQCFELKVMLVGKQTHAYVDISPLSECCPG